MEIIGYQFISISGNPIGNVQATIKEAEDVGRFDSGWILEVKIQTSPKAPYNSIISMSRLRTISSGY